MQIKLSSQTEIKKMLLTMDTAGYRAVTVDSPHGPINGFLKNEIIYLNRDLVKSKIGRGKSSQRFVEYLEVALNQLINKEGKHAEKN